MRTVFVIGIGAGSPQHVTLEAIAALRQTDVVLAFDKGEVKEDLLALRREILAAHAPHVPLVTMVDPPRDRQPKQYVGEVKRWLHARSELLQEALLEHVPESGAAAILVWGDPSLYDSTLRILANMQTQVRVKVIPGITAIQALTAAHAIPLNRIASDITITTGRQFPDTYNKDNCVVMLDGGAAWRTCTDPDAYIWWGAYLGMEYEVTRAGFIREIGEDLERLKQSLRDQHGWIMDIYLVRILTQEEASSSSLRRTAEAGGFVA
ncbi:precorrin-6A synthase (deacetylating) [Corynebacterium sp.]|uniref:precorrin-6A synthase (deacetylating) n=1 Tax=Corynebacterium sp. TaxID=1720 RepID=UPI0026DBC5FD|nr:precorrin-6A synthase (deacetylating) [Corynebacterium sp.]MDO5076291.1 precorrin-6A synthase (deacetylating) [Corynebacterium sp.]